MQSPLNTHQAAAYLGLSPGTLEVWRNKKKGPRYRKHGRRVVYDKCDLDAYSVSRVIETRDTARILRGGRASPSPSIGKDANQDGDAA